MNSTKTDWKLKSKVFSWLGACAQSFIPFKWTPIKPVCRWCRRCSRRCGWWRRCRRRWRSVNQTKTVAGLIYTIFDSRDNRYKQVTWRPHKKVADYPDLVTIVVLCLKTYFWGVRSCQQFVRLSSTTSFAVTTLLFVTQ